MKSIARQLAFNAFIVGMWLLVARLRIWPTYLFPKWVTKMTVRPAPNMKRPALAVQ